MEDQLSLEICHDEKDPNLVWLSLSINGIAFDGGFTVNLLGLVDSLSASGEHIIFTCGCGEPLCARIYMNCIVVHTAQRVRWLIPFPLQKDPESIVAGEKDSRNMVMSVYYFDREQYRNEITNVTIRLANLCKENPKIDLCPYGFSPEDVEEIVQIVRRV